MEFEPAVDDEAPGFWGGYYKGLSVILLVILGIVQIGVVVHTLVKYPLEAFWSQLKHFYRAENHTFYWVMIVLLVLSILGYVIGTVMGPSKNTKPH